jgi:hypothetical protein
VSDRRHSLSLEELSSVREKNSLDAVFYIV